MVDNTNDSIEQNKAALASDFEQTKKVIENDGHSALRRALIWLKKEFEAVGLKIEEELKKI